MDTKKNIGRFCYFFLEVAWHLFFSTFENCLKCSLLFKRRHILTKGPTVSAVNKTNTLTNVTRLTKRKVKNEYGYLKGQILIGI